ncbi:hypothetical protein V492_01229 [Pseudogymnoascus sp. VKM F-4246]|nr:hypothetical protein V492_01229 [Pseudogymnoascus sp. VKM F-4246]
MPPCAAREGWKNMFGYGMDRNEGANIVGSIGLRLAFLMLGEDNVGPHWHAPRIISIFMSGASLITVAQRHSQAVEAEAPVPPGRADGMAVVA